MNNLFKIFSLCFLLFFTKCTNDLQKEVAPKDKLICGIDATYPPFSFIENDELKGFDVDLNKLIAKELNMEIEIQQMEWSSVIAALISNKIDFVSSFVTSPLREKNIDFSKSYHTHSLAIVYKKDFPIRNEVEWNNKKIAYILGNITDKWIVESIKNANLVILDSDVQAIKSLEVDHISGFLTYKELANLYCKKNPNIDYFVLKLSDEGLGVGMKKDSPLLPKINQALDNLESRGEIQKLKEKWFKE